MAIQMIKHTLTPGWAKVASGAVAALLQGYERTFQVYFGNTPPDASAQGLLAPHGERDLSVSGMPPSEVWVRAVNDYSAGNLITGMVAS